MGNSDDGSWFVLSLWCIYHYVTVPVRAVVNSLVDSWRHETGVFWVSSQAVGGAWLFMSLCFLFAAFWSATSALIGSKIFFSLSQTLPGCVSESWVVSRFCPSGSRICLPSVTANILKCALFPFIKRVANTLTRQLNIFFSTISCVSNYRLPIYWYSLHSEFVSDTRHWYTVGPYIYQMLLTAAVQYQVPSSGLLVVLRVKLTRQSKVVQWQRQLLVLRQDGSDSPPFNGKPHFESATVCFH